MTDGQSEACRANEVIAERVTLGPAVKWHDGRQWRTGNRLMLPQDRPGRALVSSFGEIWVVPQSWLRPLNSDPVNLRSD